MFLLPTAIFRCIAFADEEATLSEDIKSILDGLDLSSLQEYLDECGTEFSKSFGDSAREMVEYLLEGNFNISYSAYIKKVLSTLFGGITSLLPAFYQIIAVTIMSAICTDVQGGIISKTTSKAIRLACMAVVLLILSSMLIDIFSTAKSCVTNIQRQVEVVAPILITLTILSGGNSAGALYQPCAVFLSDGAIYVVNSVILPLTLAVIVFNFMSRLNPDISFTGVGTLIKSAMKWILGITAAVFGIFITAQSTSSSLFNGIFFKVTKYLVGNSVPIVGGFLSSGVDMVVMSGSAVKSAVGLTGIVLLLGEVVPAVVELASFSLMLKITAAVAQPLGENSMFGTFSDLSKDVEYLIAGVLTVGFLYFLTAMLIINSANAFI